MHTFIGIDPGVEPALAIIRGSRLLVLTRINRAGRTADPLHLVAELRPYAGPLTYATLEQVGPMAAQGLVSSCNLMGSLGIIQGVLAALEIPYHFPTPQVWKKSVLEAAGYDMGRETDNPKEVQKDAAVTHAMKLFPTATLVQKRCRVPDHNLAEALLLAHYGRTKGPPK